VHKKQKVAAVCLALKRHFEPDSDVLICTFAAKKIGNCLLILGRDTVHFLMT
jgi:hypothetical protein